MRHCLTLLCFLFALPAYADDAIDLVARSDYAGALEAAHNANDNLLVAYAEWAALRAPDASTPAAFADGYFFLSKHPGWPDENTIRLRTEEAALDSAPDKETMKHFCADFPPVSGRGMFACAIAGVGSMEERHTWIHQGWLKGDFSEYEESLILSNFGKELAVDEHNRRTDRLLFEERSAEAKRMFPYVSRQRVPLYMARISLAANAHDAASRLNSVPVNLKRDSGLLFDRIRWRHHKKDDQGVIELFLSGPADPPYADLWWPLRANAVRNALNDGHYEQAVRILKNHGQLKPEAMTDALFLKGWIALTYLHDTHASYKDFYQLYTFATAPVSKARAAYWAAESARLNGNPEIMREWQEKAAARPLSFYGQLSYATLHPGVALPIPAEPAIAVADETAFNNEERVQLIKLLAQHGQKDTANHFIQSLAAQADEPSRLALLARLAGDLGQPAGTVRVAKTALKKGTILIKAGWPVIDIPQTGVEPALALAIIRQESEFDPDAQSPSGARGLMQLMLATARSTGNKNGIDVDGGSIFEPSVNTALGASYLNELIGKMDGSYVMAIAAYNAGPGNVHNWEGQLGRPGHDVPSAINWIENIPFSETRNYVMRTMENLQIYRQRLDPDATPQLAEDLTR